MTTLKDQEQKRFDRLWECPINNKREERNGEPVYNDNLPFIVFPENKYPPIRCLGCNRPYCIVIVDNEIVKTRRQRLRVAKMLCRERVKQNAKAKARRKP